MTFNKLNIFLLSVILGLAITVPAMAIPTASLNLLNTPNDVGDTFNVEIWADGDDTGFGLLFFGFDVTFDIGGIFSYSGYTLGEEFVSDSIEGIDIAASTFPAISDNNVLLANLSFSVIDFGTETIRILGLYDGLFSGLYYELTNGELGGYDINSSLSLTVESEPQPSPVPEPSSMLLLGIGIVSLSAIRLRLEKLW